MLSAQSSESPPQGSGEWDELRVWLRHRATEVIKLVTILVQDAVILLVGFLAEFAYERWLHSSQPFFQLAISLSSALFLLLYGITVTVHIVQYVRGQFGAAPASLLGQYLPWGLAACGVIAAAVAVTVPSFGRAAADAAAPAARVMRLQVNPPENTRFTSPTAVAGANGGTISPDGTRLVFVAAGSSGGAALLWVRPLDSFAARPLPGTEGALFPFWSPDSRFIGFFANFKLKKIDAAGGPPQSLCDLSGAGSGGTWGSNGVILFGKLGSSIFRVSAEGGQPVPVTTLDDARKETAHRWPSFFPDGRHFLYFADAPATEARGIYAGSVETGTVKRLVASDTNATYASGFLLFMRAGTLLRQAFDAERLELQGEATPVEQISQDTAGRLGAFSTSATGVLTFRPGVTASTQFAWFDRTGRLLETVGPPGNYAHPALSPDETRLAFTRTDQQTSDIWVLDLSRQTLSRLTFNPGSESVPIWSPDGSKILYRSDQDGGGIFEKNSSGTGSEQLVFKGPVQTAQVSPDGKFLLAYAVLPATNSQDIFVLPLAGDRKPILIVHTSLNDVEPQFSPDGRWIAYVSAETGRLEVYVQPFPVTGAKWQISSAGGRQPFWRGDGKELFFVTLERKFYAVDIRAGSSFAYGAPHVLFDLRAAVTNSRNVYVPSRDGQRFLVVMPLDAAASPINVVLNWTAGLTK